MILSTLTHDATELKNAKTIEKTLFFTNKSLCTDKRALIFNYRPR